MIKSGITDHHTIFIQIPFLFQKNNSNTVKLTFRDCSEPNSIIFEESLRNFNWDGLKSTNVNDYTQNFNTALNDIYRESFPLKSKSVSQKYFLNPWYTKDVKDLSEARNRYHKLLLQGLVSRSDYARYRNKITALIKKCKEAYYQRCFTRNIGNIRASWKIIRKICSGSQSNSIEKIISENSIFTNPGEMVEIFNKFFVNIANDLADGLPTSTNSPYEHVITNPLPHFVLDPVTPDECAGIIASLKNTKQHLDHISVEVFKRFNIYYLNTICDIINLSFSTGIFPNCFKHAIVVPIFKKGDTSDVSNYRPIALLPFLSKIIERCLFTRLLNYADACNLLTPNQFGFTKGRSTQDAIISLTEKIYECLNEGDGSFCLNVFVDFQKCFDTIDHNILINKLFLYGITGTPLKLIKDYLSNRTQSVRINGVVSSPSPITKGVIQGSILGPLCFLFFINDLPNISPNFTSFLFADDTTLNFRCSSISECNEVCNREMDKFFQWTAANKLSINFGINKSYCIIHTYRNLNLSELNIEINNHVLENVQQGMYLGVVIDSKLKYEDHIEYIAKKVSKSIGIIYKLSTLNIPSIILKQVYYAIVYSYLNYNAICYASTYETHLHRLFLLQKRVVRILSRAPFFAHTDPLFFANGILKIYDIYKLNVGLYMFNHWQSGQYDRTHHYNTRNRDNLLPSRPRLTITRSSLAVAGPNIWNTIPVDIQNSPSRESFKFRYKKHLLSFYSLETD